MQDPPIFDDSYHALHAGGERVLCVSRSGKEFEDAPAITRAAEALRGALSGKRRSRTALVIDLRKARGRTDPAFEAVWEPLRRELFSGWAAVSIICETEVGRMHVQRHMRQDGLDWHVVTDPDEALAFARGAVS